MKKIMLALVLCLSLSLVACGTGNSNKVEGNKSAFEVISELKQLSEAQGLPNLGLLGKDERSKETVSRYLSSMDGTEKFDVTGFIDGAVISPFMNVDARGILVLRFDDSVDKELVKESMKNFASYLICVQIEEYEITNVGNYYLFSGVQENSAIVEAFENMSFERDENITSESSIDVVTSKIFADSETSYFQSIRLFDTEDTMLQLKYTLDPNAEIDVEGVKSAFLMFNSETQEVIYIMKADLNEDLREAVNGLENIFINMHMSEDVLENTQVAENGQYIIFTSTSNNEKIIEAFNNLNLK